MPSRATYYRHKKLGPPTIRRYSPEEDALVTTLVERGYTYREIAERIGRPVSSVQDRVISVLRLPYQEFQKMRGTVGRYCEACGAGFHVRARKLQHDAARFCSRGCASRAQVKPSRVVRPTFRGDDWPRVRKFFLSRFKACWRCAKRERNLHVHHVVPYRLTQDNSAENLVVLCASCHRHVEEATKLILSVVDHPQTVRVLVVERLLGPWFIHMSRWQKSATSWLSTATPALTRRTSTPS